MRGVREAGRDLPKWRERLAATKNTGGWSMQRKFVLRELINGNFPRPVGIKHGWSDTVNKIGSTMMFAAEAT
jgi:hypothetical protein